MFSSCNARAADSHWKEPDENNNRIHQKMTLVLTDSVVQHIWHALLVPVLCSVCPDGSYTVIHFPFHTATRSCRNTFFYFCIYIHIKYNKFINVLFIYTFIFLFCEIVEINFTDLALKKTLQSITKESTIIIISSCEQ